MIDQQYARWIKSRQDKLGDINITDAVMSRITQKSHKSSFLKSAWEIFLLKVIQAKAPLQVGLLISGALMGMIRMVVQIYAVLFV